MAFQSLFEGLKNFSAVLELNYDIELRLEFCVRGTDVCRLEQFSPGWHPSLSVCA